MRCFIMNNKKIFIDFDGVIFDTEKRVVERKNENPNLTWNEFFDYVKPLVPGHVL